MNAIVSQDEATKGNAATQLAKRKNHLQACIFCGDMVNLDEEGTQFRDGTAAHEECHDSDTFNRENAGDSRD